MNSSRLRTRPACRCRRDGEPALRRTRAPEGGPRFVAAAQTAPRGLMIPGKHLRHEDGFHDGRYQ